MRTIIDLPKDQIEQLDALSQRKRLSRAELVRRAISEYVSRNQPGHDDAAFGLWRGRDEDGLAYQRRQRDEWDR